MPLDAEPPNNRSVQRDENLDVVRTSVKKTHSPKALRENLPLIRTYLLCALSRHSLIGSGNLVAAIVRGAENTFRSLRRPMSSRRSILQNRSTSLWWPILLFTGRGLSRLMTTMAFASPKFVRV